MYEWLQMLLLPFLDLVNCKPLVPSKRVLSPGVSVHMQSSRKNSLMNVKGRNTTNAYAKCNFNTNQQDPTMQPTSVPSSK